MVHQLHGKNQVVIGYKENNLFTKAFLIQLISWVFLIIFVGIKKINSKHRLQ
jgi:positive regulator of sigma E activity